MEKSIKNIASLILSAHILLITILLQFAYVKVTAEEKMVYPAEVIHDLFAFWRSNLMILSGGISILLLFLLLFFGSIHRQGRGIAAIGLVYCVLAGFSTALSQFQDVALLGVVQRYEGLLVLLAYMLLFALGLWSVNSRARLTVVYWGALLGTVAVGLIAFLQLNRWNPLELSFLNTLTHLTNPYGPKNTLLNNHGLVYSTMINMNFLSWFGAVTAVISSITLIKERSISSGLFFVSGLVCLAGSASFGGAFAWWMGSLVVFSLLNWKGVLPWKLWLGLSVGTAVFSIGVQTFYHNGAADVMLLNAFGSLLHGGSLGSIIWLQKHGVKLSTVMKGFISVVGLGVLISGLYVFVPANSSQEFELNLQKKRIEFTYEGNTINLYQGKSGVLMADGGVEAVSLESGQNTLTFNDGRTEKITLSADNGYHKITVDSVPLSFYHNAEGFFAESSARTPVQPVQAEQWGFWGKEDFGSGRGLIWSKSLPLLKRTLFLGVGPDCFVLEFPQNDVIAKLKFGPPLIIIDKPHSWFLQVAINTGILSLLSLLGLLGLCLKYSMDRIRSHDREAVFSGVAVVGLCSVFLLGGLFYDSIIGFSGFFWPLLGAYTGMLWVEKEPVYSEIIR